MFLSVLIPTYNYKCYTLVHDLWQQLETAGADYEVLVMDDGGKDQVCAIANWLINDLPHCRFVRNETNQGRARVRNRLAAEAQGDCLLFIDADARVVREDFIATYLRALQEHPETDVFCGDLVNPPALPSPKVTLRYEYERKAEPNRTVQVRQQYPYERISTFNILLRRSAWEAVPFDESCVEYGFEDALMGIEMQRCGKRMLHLDNPLMHLGFEPNEVYLRKVETALQTLHRLGDRMVPYTSLGRYIERLRQRHLLLPVRIAYGLLKPWLRRNLLGEHPDLRLFAFYKLGYYLNLR